jgi:hypothetical protein
MEGVQHFNVLAGVLFNEDYSVERAALIPHTVLLSLDKERSHIAFQAHTNSHIFLLVDEIWKIQNNAKVELFSLSKNAM